MYLDIISTYVTSEMDLSGGFVHPWFHFAGEIGPGGTDPPEKSISPVTYSIYIWSHTVECNHIGTVWAEMSSRRELTWQTGVKTD